ncbi:helix-turn-helix transcriptional regulator [Haloechinothrix salitolerans]|uniref:Helix-turn-helix domain-containing protein n=1 Tax=Haloechinothrix salitolerans TaxID=926830 RepID=A0ABW2C878_9PSEU
MIENEGDAPEQMYRLRLRAIGSRIRARRREQDLTQEEMARRARMSRPQLSHLERNGKNMNLTTLFRIAQVLDVHPADLIDDRDR